MRSTLTSLPSTARKISSSERQRPWQAAAAAQIGQWFSTNRKLSQPASATLASGGLEAAAAYVAVRATFPEQVWSRTIALMSTSWSMSVLVGPLVGGMFARFGSWRSAFVATAVTAGVLAVGAFFILPAAMSVRRTPAPRVPGGRVALICIAIAGTSSASIVGPPLAKVGLIIVALVALVLMLRLH